MNGAGQSRTTPRRWLWLAALALVPLQQASAEGIACERKGQSRHSLSVEGGIVDSRLDYSLRAPIGQEALFRALTPAFEGSAESVVRWLREGSGLDLGQLLNSPAGARLLSAHFDSAIHRRSLASSLQGEGREALNGLAQAGSLDSYFQSLNTSELAAIASIDASAGPPLSDFANRLGAALSSGQGSEQVVAELGSSADLLSEFSQEALTSDDGTLIGIASAMASHAAFLPVIVASPSIADDALANVAGLSLLLDSIGQTDLGGKVRWYPEEEVELALNYGYDALNWLTVNAGYRYFGAEKGSRHTTRAGLNQGFALGRARLRSHGLDFGVEMGCYFDVWRPFIGLGVQYAYRSLFASDPLLGSLRSDDWILSYRYGLGLDVDLSKYVEMRIGYHFRHFPRQSRTISQQLSYTPAGFSQPIQIDKLPIELAQSGKSSGFFIYLRFFP